MVTLAVAVATNPQASVALKVTVVIPNGKSAGASCVTVRLPSSASVALADVRNAAMSGCVATMGAVPAATVSVNGDGALTTASVFGVSLTVTVEVPVVVMGIPDGSPLSVTAKVTTVSPNEKSLGALWVM